MAMIITFVIFYLKGLSLLLATLTYDQFSYLGMTHFGDIFCVNPHKGKQNNNLVKYIMKEITEVIYNANYVS